MIFESLISIAFDLSVLPALSDKQQDHSIDSSEDNSIALTNGLDSPKIAFGKSDSTLLRIKQQPIFLSALQMIYFILKTAPSMSELIGKYLLLLINM